MAAVSLDRLGPPLVTVDISSYSRPAPPPRPKRDPIWKYVSYQIPSWPLNPINQRPWAEKARALEEMVREVRAFLRAENAGRGALYGQTQAALIQYAICEAEGLYKDSIDTRKCNFNHVASLAQRFLHSIDASRDFKESLKEMILAANSAFQNAFRDLRPNNLEFAPPTYQAEHLPTLNQNQDSIHKRDELLLLLNRYLRKLHGYPTELTPPTFMELINSIESYLFAEAGLPKIEYNDDPRFFLAIRAFVLTSGEFRRGTCDLSTEFNHLRSLLPKNHRRS